jgi:3-hydroxyacyl-CoA dehydrogenase
MADAGVRRVGSVLVVSLNNPPLNAFSAALRQGLADAIGLAQSASDVDAVVIRGEGRAFSAGADISEFGKPPEGPSLAVLVDVIEQSNKPVIAAIHGPALGGGLEIALACHYRLATPAAKLGLPEVKLGLLPGAGGTQRLPRIVGVEAALEMIVSGEPVSPARAAEIGLVDKVIGAGSVETDALAFAAEVVGRREHPRASQRTDKIAEAVRDPGVFDRFRQAQTRRLRGLEAPEACIQAVKAAVDLPYAEGLQKERELFLKLVSGDQSRALRHIFFAERAAAKIDDIAPDTPLIAIKHVGVIGAGTMGGGIAMNFLAAGIPVTMVEREQTPLDRGVATIRKNYEASAKKGRFTDAQVQQAMALLTPSLRFEDLANCDLVIEAVFENMDIKKQVFRSLDGIVKPGAILATNTSYLNVDEIGAVTARPQDVIGLHFFSPANIMRLLEIVRGAKTSPQALKTCMELSKTIGKIAVVAGVCPGFIGNRMLAQRQREAQALILEGAKPWNVDRVLVAFGFPMGPFQMSDLAGLDIGWSAETSKSATVREVLCERGRRGQKTGKGFYDYDESRHPTPSAEVEEIIAEFAKKSGKPQRPVDDQEILERLLYPMVNEGAKILDEHMAQRASDIDIVWLNGYGWPARTGGPMFWANQIGLNTVVDALEGYIARGDAVEIAPLLRDKAARREPI